MNVIYSLGDGYTHTHAHAYTHTYTYTYTQRHTDVVDKSNFKRPDALWPKNANFTQSLLIFCDYLTVITKVL